MLLLCFGANRDLLQAAERTLHLFLKLLEGQKDAIHEEAMLGLGALIAFSGESFAPSLPLVFPHIERGLANLDDYSSFTITVGVVGDLCTSLESHMEPCVEVLVRRLLDALLSPNLHHLAKPAAFSAFGCVAQLVI